MGPLVPSRIWTSAWYGLVCSLSASPAAKANRVTVPAGFFTSVRLTIDPSAYSTRSARRTASAGGSCPLGAPPC